MRSHLGTLVPILILVATPASARAAPASTDRAQRTVATELAIRPPEGARFTLRDVDGTVLYHLDPAQLARLRRAGATFDAHQVAGARRLHHRRFSAAAFVQAVEDADRHGVLSARCLEGAAVWRVLGLPWRHLGRFCAAKEALSAHLDDYRERARNLERGGHVLVTLGSLFLAVGMAISIADAVGSARCRERVDPDGSVCMGGFATLLFGTPFLGAGTLGLAAGIPLAVVGRRRRRAAERPDEALDRGTPASLRAFVRRRDLERLVTDGPALSLGGGPARSTGLSLQLRF